jgi:hypothetical protein
MISSYKQLANPCLCILRRWQGRWKNTHLALWAMVMHIHAKSKTGTVKHRSQNYDDLLTFLTSQRLSLPTNRSCHVTESPLPQRKRKHRSCSHGSYRHNKLLHAVGRHAVEVGEVQLQVELVVEHVLAQGAAQHGLHWVLCHGVYPQPVNISVAVLAVGTLVHLWGHTHHSGWILGFPPMTLVYPKPTYPKVHSVPAEFLLASPAPVWPPQMFLVASKRVETRRKLGRRCVWRMQENLLAPSLFG